jgi:hypothetical protein
VPSHGSLGHLRQLLKAASIPIPPNVYVKAKAVAAAGGGATEEELVLFSLQELLRSEGLSLNSSSAELARVARQRDLRKDMEGVDTKNVIAEGRRRGDGSAAPSLASHPQKLPAQAAKPPAQPADSDEF